MYQDAEFYRSALHPSPEYQEFFLKKTALLSAIAHCIVQLVDHLMVVFCYWLSAEFPQPGLASFIFYLFSLKPAL